MKCKGCGREVDKLIDEEVCEGCHDKWLDKMLADPNTAPIMRLNKFKEDLDGGE